MINVGILSMQRIANYGSFLQAYGLKKILEELGCKVQFVDYHPGKTLMKGKEGSGLIRKISKTLEAFQYNAPLKEKIKFILYKKNYAANYYPYLGIDNRMNYAPKVDLLVIGSDEVFNCVQDNTNVGFSPELFGEKNNAKRLISYAASFGNTTMDRLKEYKVTSIVERMLNQFDSISVRDENSKEIIKALLKKEPYLHFDPVLIYDFVGKCDNIPKNVAEDKYMILYGYSGRFNKNECKEIKRYAKKKGLKIFCIGGVQDACDKFIDCNPFQVIAYFQHAECVVTDTFHGTILSVITHRKFVSIVRNMGYGNAEKLNDLLKKLQLTQRKIFDMSRLLEKLSEDIDFEKVDYIIEQERARSYNYLKKEVNKICIQN